MSRSCRAFVASALLFVLVVMPPVLQAQVLAVRAGAAASSEVNSDRPERVDLLVGRSTVMRMDRPIIRVSLSTADIADAVATSPSELLIHGKAPGTISLFVWTDGGRIKTFDISVRRDLSALEEQVRKLFPGEPITVASNGKDVVLSGVVSTKYVADRAAALAVGYVDKADSVVNLLRQQTGVATNQVLLQVRFAEVSRSALQELGVSLFTSPTGINNTLGRTTTEQFAAPGFDELNWSKPDMKFGTDPNSATGKFTFGDFLNLFLFSEKYDFGAMVRALKTRGLFQSLAEPNLITQDGKEASFLAGGEYPYPVVQAMSGTSSVTIVFKEFGVRLRFTPTILSDDMIHLKLAPEVSTLDFTNAVTISGFRIPALATRKTDTEVELRDGQTFAVAGLLDNTLNQTLSRVPGIGDIPILGYLFRSRAYQKNATELVVMVTPRIVHRNSPGVTPNLPGLVEPYLGNQKRVAPPPPAFSSTQSQVNAAPEQMVVPPTVAEPMPARTSGAPIAEVAATPLVAIPSTSSARPSAAAAAAAMPATPPRQPGATTAEPAAATAMETPISKADMDAINKARARELEQFKKQQKQDDGRSKKDATAAAMMTAKQVQKDREQGERARKAEAEQAVRQGEIDRKRLAEEQKQAARNQQMAAELAKADAKQKAEQAKLDAKHQEEEKKLAEKRRVEQEKIAKERQEQVIRVMEQYSGK